MLITQWNCRLINRLGIMNMQAYLIVSVFQHQKSQSLQTVVDALPSASLHQRFRHLRGTKEKCLVDVLEAHFYLFICSILIKMQLTLLPVLCGDSGEGKAFMLAGFLRLKSPQFFFSVWINGACLRPLWVLLMTLVTATPLHAPLHRWPAHQPSHVFYTILHDLKKKQQRMKRKFFVKRVFTKC